MGAATAALAACAHYAPAPLHPGRAAGADLSRAAIRQAEAGCAAVRSLETVQANALAAVDTAAAALTSAQASLG